MAWTDQKYGALSNPFQFRNRTYGPPGPSQSGYIAPAVRRKPKPAFAALSGDGGGMLDFGDMLPELQPPDLGGLGGWSGLGGLGGGLGMGNFRPAMNVQTSINPRGVFSPDLTQLAVNQALGAAGVAGDPGSLKKIFDRPGISRGPAHNAAIAPLQAQAMAQAANAGATIPLQDAATNAQSLLSGQVARDQEALGLGRGVGGINSLLAGDQQNRQTSLVSLLMRLLQG